MPDYVVGSFQELISLLARHQKGREKRIVAATRKTARRGRGIIKKNIPVAHGELRESVHAEGAFIIVDAPHAAAVNFGSRPHTPPLEPLIEWVKLRGMQGLMSDRQLGRLPGTTTVGAARAVAASLATLQHRGPGGGSLDVDAPERVARAIQQAIRRNGTRAHHFMEKSLPDIWRALDEELRAAMREPTE